MEPPGEDGIFTERVQYMFHAPSIAAGNKDPYADGGGPALLPNENRGPHYAERTAQGIGTAGGKRRMGHLSCLQRTSRAADGTPLHIRMDGPGFDAMDVPGGGNLPKLQFTIFVPTAEFFRTLRTSQASLDLQEKYGVSRRGQRPRALPHRHPAAELPRAPAPPPRLPPDRTSLTRSGQLRQPIRVPWIGVELIDWGHRHLTWECE